jgi:hypothetical protein
MKSERIIVPSFLAEIFPFLDIGFVCDDIVAMRPRPVTGVWATTTILVVSFLDIGFVCDDIVAMRSRPVTGVWASTTILIVSFLDVGRDTTIIAVWSRAILAVSCRSIDIVSFFGRNICDNLTWLVCPSKTRIEMETAPTGAAYTATAACKMRKAMTGFMVNNLEKVKVTEMKR